MHKTNEEKKEFVLRAELVKNRLKTDLQLSPSDRTDSVSALEAAALFVRSGIIRHGIKKEFCHEAAGLFYYLSALDRFSGEDKAFFRDVSAILKGIYPEDKRKGKRNR